MGIFRGAAERIFNKKDSLCCWAMYMTEFPEEAKGGSLNRYISRSYRNFQKIFHPLQSELDRENGEDNATWFGNASDPLNQQTRTLALLFAEEMGLDEDEDLY